jgi:DNA invertase Pin-like site-specific DNA recombinase
MHVPSVIHPRTGSRALRPGNLLFGGEHSVQLARRPRRGGIKRSADAVGGERHAQVRQRGLERGKFEPQLACGRLMLTILGGLADFERDLIRERTAAGRELAKAKGVRFGRKSKLTSHQRKEILARHEAGEPQTALALSYGVNQAQIASAHDTLLLISSG